jgi:hypothetical protein
MKQKTLPSDIFCRHSSVKKMQESYYRCKNVMNLELCDENSKCDELDDAVIGLSLRKRGEFLDHLNNHQPFSKCAALRGP